MNISRMIRKDMSSQVFLGSGGIFHSVLMFMMKLGWQSRYRLPILLVVAFVALNPRMRFQLFIDNREQNLDQ